MKILSCLIVILQIASQIQCYRILGIFGYCSHSHYFLGYRFMKELADRGHNVTLITCYPQKIQVKNLREVSVNSNFQGTIELHSGLVNFGTISYLGQLDFVTNIGTFYTEGILKNENVQNLLNSDEEFDLVIQEQFVNEALTYFHHRFKCPLIFFAPGPTTLFNNYMFGNLAPSSFVPNILTEHTSKMSFLERVYNTYCNIAGELYLRFIMLPKQAEVLKRLIPHAPDLDSLIYNASFLLTMSHVSLSDPLPMQKNIKDIGGYHVAPPKPLPADLKKFLDDSKEGVVLFSMGSNLKSSHFEPEKKRAILKAFSGLKQRVLWKFEEDFPEKSDNVMIMNWLPQQDVMDHPNVIAFISHGGLLGTIEAIYNGIPILGLPVFWDQKKNIKDGVEKGYAIKLDFDNINYETFSHALNEIINNPSYRKTAQERSRIMHDQPMKQIDEAVYWVEYVIRHGGARHLRSVAVDLKWYQLYLVDILLVFVGIILIILVSVKIAIKCIFSKKKSDSKIKKN